MKIFILYLLILAFGWFLGIFFSHLVLRNIFKKIPFSFAIKIGKFIYPTPTFPRDDIPENYDLLESDHCLLLQKSFEKNNSKEIPDLKKKLCALEELFNHVPIAFWFRSTRGKITYCNKNYANIFSTSDPKVIQESLDICPSLVQHALKTRQSQVARRHIVFSGERHYLEMGEIHVNQGLVGYAIDMTEMDTKTNEYTKQIYSYEDLLDHISSPIAIFGADTRLILYNQAYVKQFNFSEGFLRSNPKLSEVLDLLRQERKIPEFEDFIAHKQSRLALFKDVFQPIYELMHQPDGKTLRLVITPYPLGGIVYIFEDMTEKLALEHEYKTLVAVQKTTLDHLHEGIIVFGNDYRVRLCNRAFEEMWNTSSVINSHLNDLNMKDFPLLELMSKRLYVQNYKNIKDKYISYAYTPLPDGSHFFSFMDISDQFNHQKIEEEKEKINTHFLKLSEDLMNQISYEVKEPLNEIVKKSDEISKQSPIASSVNKLLNIIDIMSDVIKINNKSLSFDYEKNEIHSFFEQIIKKINEYYQEKNIEISTDIQTRHQFFYIDLKKMEHAFLYIFHHVIHAVDSKIILTIRDIMADRIEITIKNSKSFHREKNVKQNYNQNNLINFSFLKDLIYLHGGEIEMLINPEKSSYVRCVLYVESNVKSDFISNFA